MAFYEYLDYMLMDVVVYLGGIVLAIYKAVVTRTVAVSDRAFPWAFPMKKLTNSGISAMARKAGSIVKITKDVEKMANRLLTKEFIEARKASFYF